MCRHCRRLRLRNDDAKINEKSIKGDYKDGILTVTIPKIKERNLTKKITIS